jgi:hypothetical protein
MNYRDPKESQSIFETRTLQTQCRWKVIAYGVKLKGFSTGFPGMRYGVAGASRKIVADILRPRNRIYRWNCRVFARDTGHADSS